MTQRPYSRHWARAGWTAGLWTLAGLAQSTRPRSWSSPTRSRGRTGEPRDGAVDWRSSHRLTLERQRARPCGYLIGAAQAGAVQRLRAPGVEVVDLGPAPPQQAWEVEDYLVEAEAADQRVQRVLRPPPAAALGRPAP